MASIKKKSSGGGGANWMDTYGDMVTLLLCCRKACRTPSVAKSRRT